jgi:4a-hydroxytetrahydrobiopterin dehydratase
MSEAGWRAFLAANDVGDWVVLHGGATAAFQFASLADATRFASDVAAQCDVRNRSVLLTLSERRCTIRLTRDVWQLDAGHITLARQISAIAQIHGAAADREAVHEVQVAIAAKRDTLDVHFWRSVLGYVALADDNAVDSLGHGSTVWMQELPEEKPLRHAMHIDVSVAREHVQARLASAIAAGGRVVDDSHAPSLWTLADRAGNRVCICAWPDGAAQPHADAQA